MSIVRTDARTRRIDAHSLGYYTTPDPSSLVLVCGAFFRLSAERSWPYLEELRTLHIRAKNLRAATIELG